MKRRIAKRWIRVRTVYVDDRPVSTRWLLAPHKWKRYREFYDKYCTVQAFEHDPRLSPRMVAVLRRKPRGGRRRG